jgi:hypothetical protein
MTVGTYRTLTSRPTTWQRVDKKQTLTTEVFTGWSITEKDATDGVLYRRTSDLIFSLLIIMF